MIVKRQFTPETMSAGASPPAMTDANLAGASTIDGPARLLQSKLADAIAFAPQDNTWQVDLGHTATFDMAPMPKLIRSIIAGISGGAFIALCLFTILD